MKSPQKQTFYLPVKESKNLVVQGVVQGEFSHVSDVESAQGYFFTPEQLNEYTANVIKQALETAAENAYTTETYEYGIDQIYEIRVVDKETITITFENTFEKFKV